MKSAESDDDIARSAAAGGFDADGRILEDKRFARRASFAAHGLQETVGVGLAACDVRAGKHSVHPAQGRFVRSCGGTSDAQMTHDVPDVGAAARRDDPHAAPLRAELPAEFP